MLNRSPSIFAPCATIIFSPIFAVRSARSEMRSSTGGVSFSPPISLPTMRSPSWATRECGRPCIPCIAPMTAAALAPLQSASVKSAARAARLIVWRKSPWPNQTLAATMPPLLTAFSSRILDASDLRPRRRLPQRSCRPQRNDLIDALPARRAWMDDAGSSRTMTFQICFDPSRLVIAATKTAPSTASA